MLILAIETSFDETAAAVIKAGDKFSCEVLSSIVSSQVALHEKTGGAVPEVAARAHVEKILPIISLALKKARVQLEQIDYVAVTAGPGLVISLLVGTDTARSLAAVLNKPLIQVNHMSGHLYSPFLIKTKKGLYRFNSSLTSQKKYFPALSLIVSGGHTELILLKNFKTYKKLGATVDDAAGEAFDKIATLLSLPYPGGPALSRLAKKGTPDAVKLPRPMLSSNNLDFSFSGLKTAVLYYLKNNPKANKADLAASAQSAIVDVLIGKTIKAAEKYKVKSILLSGGVAANSLLRQNLQAVSKKLKIKFMAADRHLCTDNAAMIGFAAYIAFKNRQNIKSFATLKTNPSWEL